MDIARANSFDKLQVSSLSRYNECEHIEYAENDLPHQGWKAGTLNPNIDTLPMINDNRYAEA